MRVVCTLKSTIGTVTVSLSEAGDSDPLDAFLNQTDLRGVVVIANSDIALAEAKQLQARLRDAAIPTAAVLPPDSSEGARRVAEACHFNFASRIEAEAHLRALTDRRPAHVIRAVVTSVSNSERMPLEAALLEETRLFSELSAAKRRVAGEKTDD